MRYLIIILLIFTIGCGLTESTKELNHQNQEAGGFIAKNAADPIIKQAGEDIKDNSIAIKTDIGEPEEPKSYSPEESAAARDRQVEEIETRLAIGNGALDWLNSVPFGKPIAVLIPSLLGVWEFLKRRKTKKKLHASYQGLEKIFEQAKNKQFLDVALGAYREGIDVYDMYEEIKKDIKKKKKSGELNHTDWSAAADLEKSPLT